MSDKCTTYTAIANDENTDEPLALVATVDFLARDCVYFTLRKRSPGLTHAFGEPVQQFYIPNDQAREMAQFILKEAGNA